MSTNKTELLANAKHWLGQAVNGGLKKIGIGTIFIFFDMTDSGSAVCTSTVSRARVAQELRTILKKMEDRLIVVPGENQ